jgi:hypothetical protein
MVRDQSQNFGPDKAVVNDNIRALQRRIGRQRQMCDRTGTSADKGDIGGLRKGGQALHGGIRWFCLLNIGYFPVFWPDALADKEICSDTGGNWKVFP